MYDDKKRISKKLLCDRRLKDVRRISWNYFINKTDVYSNHESVKCFSCLFYLYGCLNSVHSLWTKTLLNWKLDFINIILKRISCIVTYVINCFKDLVQIVIFDRFNSCHQQNVNFCLLRSVYSLQIQIYWCLWPFLLSIWKFIANSI